MLLDRSPCVSQCTGTITGSNLRFEMTTTLKRVRSLLAISGIAVPFTCTAQTNLIYNGSFENGFSAWQGSTILGARNLGNPPLNPGPISGNYLGVIWDSQGAMSQSFPTTPGDTYRIEFGMRLPDLVLGHPYTGNSVVGPAQLKLEIDHQILAYQLVENRTEWLTYAYEFKAERTRSDMELSVPHTFLWNGQVQESESLFIDNVRVTAVPEPTRMELFLVSGLGALAAGLNGGLPGRRRTKT